MAQLKENIPKIQEGDIAIVKEDNVPVMKWPLGRVIKTYKGIDEIVRVADVKTASGVFKRADRCLAPLPRVNDEGEECQQKPNQH